MFMQDITRFASAPVATANAALSQGIFGATLIETESGWRAAETLRMGDRVYTLDGGLQRIAALSRRIVAPGNRSCMSRAGISTPAMTCCCCPARASCWTRWA